MHHIFVSLLFNVTRFKCEEPGSSLKLESRHASARILKAATRKRTQLEAAATLEFLRSQPGSRLEASKGDRQAQYSIRVNDQWRICFRWTAAGAEEAGAEDVESVDYHWGRQPFLSHGFVA